MLGLRSFFRFCFVSTLYHTFPLSAVSGPGQGRYRRGAAPPMFNRPLRTAAPLCGSAAAPRGIFDSQRGLVTPAKGRRDCYRRHVRRGRSHFCDGKQSRARETRAIPQMSTRAKMTSLQICRPEITCDFRQICQRGGKATNPLGLSVRPVGRTADGSNRRFEARHRMAGEAGPPPITIRP